MDATVKAGPYYIDIGDQTTEIVQEKISAMRKKGTGHLSRGGRGFIDLIIFRSAGMTTSLLKRKVIWTHKDDINGDPIEESIKCVNEQAAYLRSLQKGNKPTIIVRHVGDGLNANGIAEAIIAVNAEFTDDVFDDLCCGPGYPQFKKPIQEA